MAGLARLICAPSPVTSPVTTILRLSGPLALSSFRKERLLASLRDLELPIADVAARYVHFVHVDRALDAD